MQLVVSQSSTPRLSGTRKVWLAFAVTLIAVTGFEAVKHSVGVWVPVAFGLGPDLAFLAAIGQPSQPGQLARRAVPIYNFVHRPLLPIALMTAASFDLVPRWCFVAGLAWLAHIAVDRVSGFGLRTPDGWQRG